MGDEKETQEIEKYEYLLVEYVKEISNEVTYLLLIVTSLFLYILVDLFPEKMEQGTEVIRVVGLSSVDMVRIIFILLMVGGFILFGLSNFTKRSIEKKFEKVFEED